MKKIGLFLSLAFFFLVLSSSVEGETFASVPLYISGEPEGALSISSPSSSTVESVTIASSEQDQGVFREIGRWSTSSLDISTNISGDWSGNAWISSNRAATVSIRYTVVQEDNNLDSFEFEGVVPAGETVEISDSSDFALTSLESSPLTLVVEASWTAQSGTPPPGDGDGDGFPDLSLIHI